MTYNANLWCRWAVWCMASVAIVMAITVAACDARDDVPPEAHSAQGVTARFTWDTFLPATDERDAFDWTAIIERGALETFNRLRKSLIENTITPDALEGFRLIVHDEEQRMEIEALCVRLNEPARREVVQRLYAALMRADSNRDVLLQKLRYEIERGFKSADEDPQNIGRYFGWGMSIANEGAIIAYEKTGDVRFLELLSDTFARMTPLRDNVLGRTDDIRGRIVHSWGALRYDNQGRYGNHITITGRVCFPMLQFVEIVREEAAHTERFGAQADELLAIAQRAMDEFADELIVTESGDQAYYLARGLNDDVEPVNHMAWAGNSMILLHKLTGEQRYGDDAQRLVRFFRQAMWIEDDGCLVWTYWPRPGEIRTEKAEHLWKARTTSQLFLFAESRGVVFTEEDLKAVARTFLTRFHRGDGRFSSRMDDLFDDMNTHLNLRGGYLCMTPFIVFEQYDPRVRTVIEDMVAARPDVGGWMRAGHGLIAYAWRLEPDDG